MRENSRQYTYSVSEVRATPYVKLYCGWEYSSSKGT